MKTTSRLLSGAAFIAAFTVGASAQTTFVTEDFDTDGEGSRYTSSSFDDGGSDFFERLTANPDPRHNAPGFTGFTFVAPQGGAGYWGSEDIDDELKHLLSVLRS